MPFAVFAPRFGRSAHHRGTSRPRDAALPGPVPGRHRLRLWAKAVKGLTPGLASRFLYLIPVLGVPIAWVWVGEAPQLLTMLGGAVTIAGVALASLRPSSVRVVPATDAVLVPGSALVADAA